MKLLDTRLPKIGNAPNDLRLSEMGENFGFGANIECIQGTFDR